MDIWSKEKRSAVMARIKSKDTKPEWVVRRYLYSRGYRYRKNVKKCRVLQTLFCENMVLLYLFMVVFGMDIVLMDIFLNQIVIIGEKK